MKITSLILSTIFLFAMQAVYAQDSSGLSKSNKLPNDTIVQSTHKAKHKARTRVDKNSGTSIPNTTSGTLNSSVNPNTQMVIPLSKSKKKKQ